MKKNAKLFAAISIFMLMFSSCTKEDLIKKINDFKGKFKSSGKVTEQTVKPAEIKPVPGSAPVIGIAWRLFQENDTYIGVIKAVKAAGGTPVILPQVFSHELKYDSDGSLGSTYRAPTGMLRQKYADKIRRTGYKKSNVQDIITSKRISAVIFPAGADVSPSLFGNPEKEDNAGEFIDAERDVSDYLLMTYCLDHDIPVLGIGRGMQVLAVACDGNVIQDFGVYFKSKGKSYSSIHQHAADASHDYMVHNVGITDKNSKLYKIYQSDLIKNVPSWHHQSVVPGSSSKFSVTAMTNTDGLDIAEAIEVKGKKFAVGIEYNPEIVITGNPTGQQKNFCSYDTALLIFKAFVNSAK